MTSSLAQPKDTPHFEAYDGLRFFAFIPIYILHAIGPIFFSKPLTACALSLYFVLAGVLAAYTKLRDFQHLSPAILPYTKRYLWAKMKQFYPLHLIGFFGCALLMFFTPSHYPIESVNDGIVKVAANLSYLQSWWLSNEVKFSFNGVTWFLSSLMFCFALTPLLLRLISRASVKWLVLLVFLCIGVSFAPYIQGFIDGGAVQAFQKANQWHTWPPLRFTEYAVGACLGVFLRRESWRGFRVPTYFIACIEIVILFVTAISIYYAFDLIPQPLFLLPIAAILYIMTLNGSILRKIFSFHLFTYLGSCIMAVFMLHNVILKYLSYVFYQFNMAASVYYALLGAILSLSVGIVWTKYITPRFFSR